MKNKIFEKVILLMMLIFSLRAMDIYAIDSKNTTKEVKSKKLEKIALDFVPMAILPFNEKGSAVEEQGALVSNLIFANMLEKGDYFMVERESLDKILKEMKLNKSGLVSSDSAVKIGNIVGAKLLITGSIFKVGKKKYIIAKIIGTETSRVIGVSQSGSDDLEVMIAKLSNKIIKSVQKKYDQLLPEKKTFDLTKWLKTNKDKFKFNKIATKIVEKSNVEIDPAVETEIKKIFKETGFEIVENADDADVIFTGEAFSENAGMFGEFFTGSARIELKLLDKKGKVLAVDRITEIAPDVSWGIAQKSALQKGARGILLNILKNIIKK
ncbi:CsgG/HfaB family protein [Lentisphaerota bacterium WC36G]|nr:CsgG/HfaB family protein [Lentisphaerae bacterium WC36]